MAMTSMKMIFQDDDDNSQSVHNVPWDLMENNPIVCCIHPWWPWSGQMFFFTFYQISNDSSKKTLIWKWSHNQNGPWCLLHWPLDDDNDNHYHVYDFEFLQISSRNEAGHCSSWSRRFTFVTHNLLHGGIRVFCRHHHRHWHCLWLSSLLSLLSSSSSSSY